MPDTGSRYPTAYTNDGAVAPEDDDLWSTPQNTASNDGTYASITAATYDSPDISRRMLLSGFGFTVPDTATIDGVLVEIERRCAAGAAKDYRVQLRDNNGALVGDNKADTATAWPGTDTLKSYGGAADGWNASLTPAIVNSASFGLAFSAQATSANTDIYCDYARITVYYTDTPPQGITGSGGIVQPAASLSAAGKERFVASAAIAAAASALSGVARLAFRGQGGVSQAQSSSGAGSERFIASGAIVTPAPSLSGAGEVPIQGYSGQGAIVAPAPSLAGSALQRFRALGGVIATATSSAVGTLRFRASGGVLAPAPSLSGQGTGGGEPDPPPPDEDRGFMRSYCLRIR